MPPLTTANTGTSSEPIHVMLVDDSAVVRGLIGRILEADPAIKVVASVSNGEQGVSSAARHHPDIVILDIEMPVMDGITALPKILAASPGVKVVMCSTLSTRNAEMTLKALELGATECIAKPTNSSAIYGEGDFKTEVLRVVKALGRRKDAVSRPSSAPAPSAAPSSATMYQGGQNAALKTKTSFELRKHLPGESFRPNLLAIGSSTGGPQALFKVISNFKNFDVPIIVTQHMPATFTKILAQHIEQHTGVPTVEGENGMAIEKGKVFVAPGGSHMTFEKKDGKVIIKLNDGPPENFCKPSVDPMLRSAIEMWGPKFLTVILTGMGHDGLEGCKRVAEGGGRVVAQDQESSVVWGMPGAVSVAGICTAVLPLQDIGPWVRQAFGK